MFIDGKRRSFFGKNSEEASNKLLDALEGLEEGGQSVGEEPGKP